ncbi:sulfite dehydrogenase (cytochrome) subunit SorA apoprotein [Roseimicrobium gellanilyticum]|uniref:Sulfite dehydrogenase (Cytochrome) subunit SorA apoprotein n=1 Tax=Roseimicrobium gellanilyticum TaxID=748857 RepID=A0A366HVA1_9BACT|nr:molybdopterin-dependent oxidoreductase [Roseimicrobium gellanilyticum]RBP47228.1 sulfite dehydrogenase (cytochrome) subunit SorA apoprotein [Roseimicrobium gellanilyticum]
MRQTALAVGTLAGVSHLPAEETITLPFENGERRLVKFPQKRPLILLTQRPPQLETPFSVFREGVLTPNDAFFVRYHLQNIPRKIDVKTFRLEVKGLVKSPLALSLDELKTQFENTEVVAVNQCSGNSRGFFKPRVGGGQLAHGAMGNARWRGVRLKDVLNKAGLQEGAKQVVCNGLDTAPLPQTPDFIKALEVDHALDGEILLAWEMNGEPLPLLNGYPLRLVVPGYFGTYWIKHLNELTVVKDAFDGFFMAAGYRIPATPGGCIEPGTTPASTVPITQFTIRSFITSHETGAKVEKGRAIQLSGIAFDAGRGITDVTVSDDGGKTWRTAVLGKDHGRYSFRPWTFDWAPSQNGEVELKCRATNRLGETQPLEPLWNPAGYMRNVVETTRVSVG